jgi:hypothetical protein
LNSIIVPPPLDPFPAIIRPSRCYAKFATEPATPREQEKRPEESNQSEPRILAHPCPCCGGRMIVTETFEGGRAPRGSSLFEIRIDTS